MSFNALLLAAGKGTRLKPLTDNWPKCLMPVHGLPLLEYWLSDVLEAGAERVFVNTSHLGGIVETYLGRDRFAGRVSTLREPALLGTAGTILSIESELNNQPTLVVHADNWCGMPISDFLSRHYQRPKGCVMTMMTFLTDTPESCGIIELDSRGIVTRFHEKVSSPPSNLANGAVYVIEPEVVKWMAQMDLSDFSTEVLPYFLNRIFAVHNMYWHRDIGTLTSLKKAQQDPTKITIWDSKDIWLEQFAHNPVHQYILEK